METKDYIAYQYKSTCYYLTETQIFEETVCYPATWSTRRVYCQIVKRAQGIARKSFGHDNFVNYTFLQGCVYPDSFDFTRDVLS
jgi:hypothetical protein